MHTNSQVLTATEKILQYLLESQSGREEFIEKETILMLHVHHLMFFSETKAKMIAIIVCFDRKKVLQREVLSISDVARVYFPCSFRLSGKTEKQRKGEL